MEEGGGGGVWWAKCGDQCMPFLTHKSSQEMVVE